MKNKSREKQNMNSANNSNAKSNEKQSSRQKNNCH